MLPTSRPASCSVSSSYRQSLPIEHDLGESSGSAVDAGCRSWIRGLERLGPGKGRKIPRNAELKQPPKSRSVAPIPARTHLGCRDLQAAIPGLGDALPIKVLQRPVASLTLIFEQFDDVSLMAARYSESNPLSRAYDACPCWLMSLLAWMLAFRRNMLL